MALASPAILALVALALCVVLVVLCAFAIRFYSEAKRINPHLRQLDAVKQEIAVGQNKYAQICREIEDRKKDVADANAAIADGKSAKAFLARHDSEIRKCRAAEEAAKDAASAAAEKYEKKKKALAEKTQEIIDVSAKLESAKNELKKITDELVPAKNEATKLKVDNETLTKKNAELTSENTKLQQAKADLDAEITKLRDERAKLSGQTEELQKQHATLEKEISSLAEEKTDAQKVITESEKVRRDLAARQNIWNSLEENVFPQSNVRLRDFTPRKLPTAETDWLKELQKNLRAAGFRFSDRTIYAFHTSLKCYDRSPLVVLAGISGTGKSLLPELYARALGANFLAVPVRPNWDSANDLIGFYNYAEKKFSATALSRLLWQTSETKSVVPENASSVPAEQKFIEILEDKRAMNLILLDEMNLARVEYYFSDMLSLLEMRRGGNTAKIPLEAGTETQQIDLSFNNIFIGTMNEDETTQMLSDKVIDRANVLRFGCPPRLDASPDKQKFFDACKNSENSRLPFGEWKKWRKQPDKPLPDKLRLDLEALKNAMNDVGKPFGYRVADAVRAYVANYPVPANVDDAFSDQIEMKVLPKLNGLDGQNPKYDVAMSKISEIIEKYNDSALLKEFRRAREDGKASFFTWRGVGRVGAE